MSNFNYAPPDVPLDMVHEDHELLLVNKPAGLLSVPGKGEHLADCLIARLQVAFPEALLVHRLDMDTSGVMVFARSPAAQRHLGLQFEKRHVKKAYVARVWGEVAEKQGHIDLPLIVDWPNRPLQHVDYETGKPAQTDWRRMRVDADGTTRLRLHPLTGRSHQLRVHMREIGHPILGDPFYATGAARDFPRLMLHAESLKLRHPDGGKGLLFRAPVPF
ncbi:RluA family pseudouridine synthase [Gymnodinialimonas sp. 2305UL16-5]|uniref:RluA family pseudouridine synthase n=1 Tax=Gymnodinialimonas mytili TaxID=3126503 RepID=UPI00309E4238